MEKAEVTGVKPSGEPIQLAQAVAGKPENGNTAATPTESNAAQSSASSSNTPNASTANTTTQAAAQTHPKRLPQTGSELPLISLLGVCSLGAAMIAHHFRRVL